MSLTANQPSLTAINPWVPLFIKDSSLQTQINSMAREWAFSTVIALGDLTGFP